MRWVPVSREVFEYEMVPWVGREYAAWLRTSARPHPADEHRLVLIPERVYRVFQERKPGEHVTPAQLAAMRYPRLPDEDELEAAARGEHSSSSRIALLRTATTSSAAASSHPPRR